MKRVIFSKYSNDRNDSYKIHTDILEDEQGNRYVRKVAASEAGKKHILHMHESARALQKMYEGSEFVVNRSQLQGEILELEYVEGKSMEELLDGYLDEKDYDGFCGMVRLYGQELRKLAVNNFTPCENYYKVFGDDAISALEYKSMPYGNIDMIFENLIVKNDSWVVLDYEWTFMFPVPVDFILYRAVHYYVTPDREKIIGDLDLYGILGIDSADCDSYRRMEEHFQAFVCADNTPLWKLYETMGRSYYFPAGLTECKRLEEVQRRIEIVKFFENSSEYTSEVLQIEPDDAGNLVFDIEIDRKYAAVRIDPAACACIVYVNKMVGIAGGEYEIQYGCNGVSTDNKLIGFETDDPQILIGDLRDGLKTIHVEFNIAYCNKAMVRQIECIFDSFNGMRCDNMKKDIRISEQEQLINEKNEKLEELNKNIEDMENSTSWKITKPMRLVSAKIRR